MTARFLTRTGMSIMRIIMDIAIRTIRPAAIKVRVVIVDRVYRAGLDLSSRGGISGRTCALAEFILLFGLGSPVYR